MDVVHVQLIGSVHIRDNVKVRVVGLETHAAKLHIVIIAGRGGLADVFWTDGAVRSSGLLVAQGLMEEAVCVTEGTS